MLHAPFCDNAIFIALCINNVLAPKILWSDEVKQQRLAASNLNILGCIKKFNDTLVKIRKPWIHANHVKLLNGHKMNL